MKHKPLGKTGLKVPPIIFGTSALGNLYTELDYSVKKEIVQQCFAHVDAPVVFDSAGKYGAGLALEMLGKCLNDLHISSDQVLISNKLGWQRIPLETPEPTFEKGVWINVKHDARQTINYEGIIRCWEQGNILLGDTCRPQLLSVHDPDEYLARARNKNEREALVKDITEAYTALHDLKKSGKIKAVGIGAKDWKVIRELADKIELDWVMFANSMTIFTHPPELLQFMDKLHKVEVGIINSAVFNAGFLIGGAYFNYVKLNPENSEHKKIFKWRHEFMALCNDYSINPADACVHFAFTAPGVVSVSLNTSNPDRVAKNVETVQNEVPNEFYEAMKQKGLISVEYPYVG
jgi:D-threo-aldose 1-dehydrogenase